MKKKTAEFLDSILEAIINFSPIEELKRFGRFLKYLIFNIGVKLVMFGFEIVTLMIFIFVLYFLMDTYINHRVGLSLIQYAETAFHMEKALAYNSEINNFVGTTGIFIGVITTLIGGISAMFVKMISHILYQYKCEKNKHVEKMEQFNNGDD